ncbi:UNVERIFIED_CONTAM: hypothetical protein FKN15_069919 [Acipenser sinensis]
MESIEELIVRINRNTAAQLEQTERWERELGLAPLEARERESTELELLLQKWEQAREAPLSAVPAREAPQSPAPEDVVLCPEQEESFPESEEGQPREREVPPPATDKGEEGRSPPPPQPRPPPLRSGPALLQVIPCPLLLDTLPVCLDLPALDLELRSVHHRPQLYPWFPSPLSPITQTSLGCCQTSLVLPLLAAKLPLGDRTSLRRAPGEDLCPLLHPPVPRPSLRSPLSSQWGPVSPVRTQLYYDEYDNVRYGATVTSPRNWSVLVLSRIMRINENTLLEGKHVVLVPYNPEHVPRYHQWMGSAELQKLTASEPLTLEQEYEMQKSWREDDDKCTFIILDKHRWADPSVPEQDCMLGDVNIFLTDPEDTSLGEVEIMIAEPSYRGRGFGKEVTRMIMCYGKEALH